MPQGSHFSGLTKFHDISMIFPEYVQVYLVAEFLTGFFKKILGIFAIIFRPPITFG